MTLDIPMHHANGTTHSNPNSTLVSSMTTTAQRPGWRHITTPNSSLVSAHAAGINPYFMDEDTANIGILNDEIVTLIVDMMIEDDAMRHHRSFECPNSQKHYPLFRLRPHSAGLAKLCLVSKHMRHRVLTRLYRTLRFHGGGAEARDEWEQFNAHMTIKDTPQVQLSQPKIYIKEILCARPVSNKEYAENLFNLMQSCRNLERIDPSALSTHQFFKEKRVPNIVPATVTELRCVGIQTKAAITGLVGKLQPMFSNIGRMPRNGIKGPYWKRDDFQHVTKLEIVPTFLAWTKMDFANSARSNWEQAEIPYSDIKEFIPEEENWGNLVGLETVSLDCREVGLLPKSEKYLKDYANAKFRLRNVFGNNHGTPDPYKMQGKMWQEKRDKNVFFWAMLGNTPQLPELKSLEIDLEFNPWAPEPEKGEPVYDEWYWLDEWVKRLNVKARTLVVRLHVKSPIHMFTEKRRSDGKVPEDRDAPVFEAGWLLNKLPSEERMRAVFANFNRFKPTSGPLPWKYLDVQLVAERFPRSERQIVLLREWKIIMNEHTRKLVESGKSSMVVHDTSFLEFADHFNTLTWSERLERRLHGIPTNLVGLI